MKLNQLAPNIKKARKRRGQGNASGNGTFAGRGCKGQNARSGGGVRLGFEGGQTPLIQRMPKLRGFNNPRKIIAQPLNLSALEAHFEDGETVNFETLVSKRLVRKNNPAVKILGEGELTKKLTLAPEILVSKSAKEVITKAGGTVEEGK